LAALFWNSQIKDVGAAVSGFMDGSLSAGLNDKTGVALLGIYAVVNIVMIHYGA
jgi:hypothetical protein